MTRQSLIWITLVLGLMLYACAKTDSQAVDETESGNTAGIANPASVYCEGLGYELEMRTTDVGTSGICIFPDGSECDEWDFLSGRCGQEFSYCQTQGYKLISEEGSNIGICVFSDGSSCMELDYFEGRCEPGR